MTIEEIIAQLEGFSTKELEKLAHEINVILYARDEIAECVEEMICQRCGHEIDCFCGCRCLCHEMV